MMKSWSKVVSERFMIDVLTPFLPYMKDQDKIKELKIIKSLEKYFIIEYYVEEGGAIVN